MSLINNNEINTFRSRQTTMFLSDYAYCSRGTSETSALWILHRLKGSPVRRAVVEYFSPAKINNDIRGSRGTYRHVSPRSHLITTTKYYIIT